MSQFVIYGNYSFNNYEFVWKLRTGHNVAWCKTLFTVSLLEARLICLNLTWCGHMCACVLPVLWAETCSRLVHCPDNLSYIYKQHSETEKARGIKLH
jgi:hypothetical protein